MRVEIDRSVIPAQPPAMSSKTKAQRYVVRFMRLPSPVRPESTCDGGLGASVKNPVLNSLSDGDGREDDSVCDEHAKYSVRDSRRGAANGSGRCILGHIALTCNQGLFPTTLAAPMPAATRQFPEILLVKGKKLYRLQRFYRLHAVVRLCRFGRCSVFMSC